LIRLKPGGRGGEGEEDEEEDVHFLSLLSLVRHRQLYLTMTTTIDKQQQSAATCVTTFYAKL
jgi:hypothetical protein